MLPLQAVATSRVRHSVTPAPAGAPLSRAERNAWSPQRAERLGHRLDPSSADGAAPLQRVNSTQKQPRRTHAQHKRRRTAFGLTTKTRRQGPHTLAHVTVGVALELGLARGRRLSELLSTLAAPPTKIVNTLIRRELPGDANKEARHRLLVPYRKARIAAKSGPSATRRAAIETLLAATPVATYGLSTGSYSASEISGKGERASHARADLARLSRVPRFGGGRVPPIPSTVRTFDSRKGEPLSGARVNYARQLGRFATSDDALSDVDDIDSTSDTDMDLDSDSD
jgi:hypothetical protein